jgi:hypothetical protein
MQTMLAKKNRKIIGWTNMTINIVDKMIENANTDWLARASEYQADRAYAYFWMETLSNEDLSDEEKFILFDKGYLELVDEDNDPYDFVKFLMALKMRDTWDASSGDYDPIAESEFDIIVNTKMRADFNDFAKDWVDLTDDEAYEEFYIKYSRDFKKSWISKLIKDTPTDEQIFGDLWKEISEESDLSEKVIDEMPVEDEEIVEDKKMLDLIGGSSVWVNEDDGSIKISRTQPGDNYVLVESVNTGYKQQNGKTIFVPSTLDGVADWWMSIGKSRLRLDRKDNTTLVIKNGGMYSKDWIRRYFFVKDKDGDLIVSY